MRLLIKAIEKKIPETTLIFEVVLGSSKFTPIAITNAEARKIKLPELKSNLL